MNLDVIEAAWKQVSEQDLKGLQQVVINDLNQFDKNIWIHIRAMKYLSELMPIEDMVELTSIGKWERNEDGEKCMMEKIESIIRKENNEQARIRLWQVLGKNKRFKSYSLAKLASIEYRNGNNKKAMILMLLAESRGRMRNDHKRIKLHIAANQERHIREKMLKGLMYEHENTRSIEVFSSLMTLAIISGGKDYTERFYTSPKETLIQRWEYLLWFNRIPLKLSNEEEFINKIQKNYLKALGENDYRWLYQYALAIIRHGNYLEGYALLTRVNQEHKSLGHLCKPVIRCLREYKEDENKAKKELTCRTQRLRINRANNQKGICVLFSGWYSALGNIPDYIIKEQLLELGISTIILKDEKLNWFLTREKKADDKLRQLIDNKIKELRTNECEVIFIGSSITGLSAIEYATVCEATTVLLYASPYREKINIKGSRKKVGKKNELKIKIIEEMFADTESRMKILELRKIQILYEFSSDNIEDSENAIKFKRFHNCNSKSYRDIATHGISGYCASMGYLTKTVRKICEIK